MRDRSSVKKYAIGIIIKLLSKSNTRKESTLCKTIKSIIYNISPINAIYVGNFTSRIFFFFLIQ